MARAPRDAWRGLGGSRASAEFETKDRIRGSRPTQQSCEKTLYIYSPLSCVGPLRASSSTGDGERRFANAMIENDRHGAVGSVAVPLCRALTLTFRVAWTHDECEQPDASQPGPSVRGVSATLGAAPDETQQLRADLDAMFVVDDEAFPPLRTAVNLVLRCADGAVSRTGARSRSGCPRCTGSRARCRMSTARVRCRWTRKPSPCSWATRTRGRFAWRRSPAPMMGCGGSHRRRLLDATETFEFEFEFES